MAERVALDTNILAYAEGVNDEPRRLAALGLLARLRGASVVVPAQVLGELGAVLAREARRPLNLVRAAILGWSDAFEVAPTTSDVLRDAMELAAARHVPVWDAVILAAAAEARCRELLSEDFQAGFAWRGCAVRNPFA